MHLSGLKAESKPNNYPDRKSCDPSYPNQNSVLIHCYPPSPILLRIGLR